MKILVTEPAETNRKSIDILISEGHTVILSDNVADRPYIEILIVRTLTRCNKNYLDGFPNLKFLLRVGVGLDNIDVKECERRKITVINAPGSNANAVAEFVIGLMIGASRNLILQSNNLLNNKWRDINLLGREIAGKTIGIVGCGAIGRLVAKKVKSFDVESILGYDPYLNKATLENHSIVKSDLDELIKKSHFITLHLPYTPETKHLISTSRFLLMKKETVLINTSRGGIVDEKALVSALKNGNIRAAAFDVFENEPQVRKELLNIPNLIATPHIAALTTEADEEMAVAPVKKLLTILNSPPHEVLAGPGR